MIKKTPSGQPSTDEDVLQELALNYPLPKLILEYRGLSKLKTTYTDKLPRMANPRTGPRAHQLMRRRWRSPDGSPATIPICRTFRSAPPRGAASAKRSSRRRAIASCRPTTRRSSCASWRICRRIRICSRPSPPAKTCIGAPQRRSLASPRRMLTSEQRRYAKVINFGLIYGMSAFGLATQLGIERGAAQQYMERYFARYPGVAQYMQRTREAARENGYVETVFGRRLFMAGHQSLEPSAAAGRRARRHQRADARHRRRPDQTGDDRGARWLEYAAAAVQADHAGA